MDLNKRQSFDSAQSASTIITAEVTTPPRGNPITRSQTLVIQNSFTFIETAGSLSLITPVALPTASNSNSVSQTSVSTVASAANTTQSANSIATPSAVASTIYGSAPLGCPTGLTTASQCYYDASGSAIAVHPTTVTTTTSVAGASASPVVFVSYVPFAALDSTNVSQTSSSASTSRGSSASNTATTRPAASSGISTAALAGAAVGCLILGALIAGLIAFFILKKRSRSRDRYVSRDTYVPTASPAYGGEKGTPMVSIASVPNMDFLPQQADDAEVKRKLSTVLDQIDQHVENFYGNRAASMSPNWEAEISRFETNELSLPLAACFQNSNVPMTLIKHCLAYHVFNLTMSPGEHGTPLLPPEMAGMVAAMYHKSLSTAATKGQFDNLLPFSQLTLKQITLRHLAPGNHLRGICVQILVEIK